MFFHVLLPQVVAKTFGREAAAAFHDASGWMRVSAGLGGNVGAEQWLYESGDLYPMEKEVIYYNALIDAVLPFQKKEMLDFLKGGQPSLGRPARSGPRYKKVLLDEFQQDFYKLGRTKLHAASA